MSGRWHRAVVLLQLVVQRLLDGSPDRALHNRQRKAEPDIEFDVALVHLEIAACAGAFDVQVIAAPLAVQRETLFEFFGYAFGTTTGFVDTEIVTSSDAHATDRSGAD